MFHKAQIDVIVLCGLIIMSLRNMFAFQLLTPGTVRYTDIEGSNSETYLPDQACPEQQLVSSPGTLTFVSPGGVGFCSLSIAAPIDNVIEIQFVYFDVGCGQGGDVAILDGWEIDYQIFPSIEDHPHSMSQRYISLCDTSELDYKYITDQNIAQIQFIIPITGQGFRVQVTFKVNYQPCNMMLLSNHYERITLRNYGMQRNCTVMSLYPQRVQFLYINIGETDRNSLFYRPKSEVIPGLKMSCRSHGEEDSVQLYKGEGVGSESWSLILMACGIRQNIDTAPIKLNCHTSALRLVSSGGYFNVVSFAVLPSSGDDGEMCYNEP